MSENDGVVVTYACAAVGGRAAELARGLLDGRKDVAEARRARLAYGGAHAALLVAATSLSLPAVERLSAAAAVDDVAALEALVVELRAQTNPATPVKGVRVENVTRELWTVLREHYTDEQPSGLLFIVYGAPKHPGGLLLQRPVTSFFSRAWVCAAPAPAADVPRPAEVVALSADGRDDAFLARLAAYASKTLHTFGVLVAELAYQQKGEPHALLSLSYAAGEAAPTPLPIERTRLYADLARYRELTAQLRGEADAIIDVLKGDISADDRDYWRLRGVDAEADYAATYWLYATAEMVVSAYERLDTRHVLVVVHDIPTEPSVLLVFTADCLAARRASTARHVQLTEQQPLDEPSSATSASMARAEGPVDLGPTAAPPSSDSVSVAASSAPSS